MAAMKRLISRAMEFLRMSIALPYSLAVLLAAGCISAFPSVQSAFPPRSVAAATFSPSLFKNVAIYVDDRTRDVPDEQGTLRIIEDAFVSAALNRGYVVATRSDAAKIVREASLQDRRILEGDIASKARLRGVSAVLLVTVDRVALNTYRPVRRVAGGWLKGEPTTTRYKSEITISARLIDAELAEIAWVSRFEGDTLINRRDDLGNVIPAFARALAADLPSTTQAPVASETPARIDYRGTPAWRGVNRLGVYVDDRTRTLSGSEGILRSIESEFIAASLGRGFIVAARADIPDLNRELRLQNQSPQIDEVVARMGRMLRVDAIVVVSINQLTTDHYRESSVAPDQVKINATVGARVVSADGKILWVRDNSGTAYGFDRSDATAYVVMLARSLADLLPGTTAVRSTRSEREPPSLSTATNVSALPRTVCAPRSSLVGVSGAAEARNWKDSLRLQLIPLVSVSDNSLRPLEVRVDGITASPMKDITVVVTRIANGKVRAPSGVAGMVARKHLNRTLTIGEQVYVTALSVHDKDVEVTLVSSLATPIPSNGVTMNSQFKAFVHWDFAEGQLRFMPREELFDVLAKTLSFEKCGN